MFHFCNGAKRFLAFTQFYIQSRAMVVAREAATINLHLKHIAHRCVQIKIKDVEISMFAVHQPSIRSIFTLLSSVHVKSVLVSRKEQVIRATARSELGKSRKQNLSHSASVWFFITFKFEVNKRIASQTSNTNRQINKQTTKQSEIGTIDDKKHNDFFFEWFFFSLTTSVCTALQRQWHWANFIAEFLSWLSFESRDQSMKIFMNRFAFSHFKFVCFVIRWTKKHQKEHRGVSWFLFFFSFLEEEKSHVVWCRNENCRDAAHFWWNMQIFAETK